MAQLQNLELAWIGKDLRPRLEPRIFLEGTKRRFDGLELSAREMKL